MRFAARVPGCYTRIIMAASTSLRPLVYLVSFTLCACSTKPSPDGGGPPSQSASATPTSPPGPSSKGTGEAVKIHSLQALDAWVAAQNQGKLDAYLALYDAGSFRGVKRTSSGAEQKLDFNAWKEERSK